MSALRLRIKAHVSGRVQGVGFRYFTARTAQRLGLHGTVKNLPDGRVRVVAAGTAAGIREFLAALRTGPAYASVASVESGPDNGTVPLPPFTISP